MYSMPTVSLAKRVPSSLTHRYGVDIIELGPESMSWTILVWRGSSIRPPAHTIILWPSPLRPVRLRSMCAIWGR